MPERPNVRMKFLGKKHEVFPLFELPRIVSIGILICFLLILGLLEVCILQDWAVATGYLHLSHKRMIIFNG